MAKQEHLDQSFNFRRIKDNGKILVCNSLSYTMAEYDENTGLTRWQRVVSASQKEHVQEWLRTHYPVKVEVKAPAAQPQRKRPRRIGFPLGWLHAIHFQK